MLNTSVYAQGLKEWDKSCMINGEVPTFKCLETVFSNILTISTALVVLILFLMFVIGGFNYLTSFGNPEKMKKAQGTLKFALVGFLLFISSYLILKIIGILFLKDPNALFNFTLPGA